MKKTLIAALLVVAPMAMAANLVELSLDSQINIGLGDAIWAQGGGNIQFTGPEGDDEGVKMNITPGGGWWYGPRISFIKAGIGTIDLSAPGATISFDAKAYQDVSNTNPYGDCNIFVRIYSGLSEAPGTYRDFGIVYGPNPTVFPFGDWANWNRVNVNVAGGSDSSGFDIHAVSQIRLYGSNWSGKGQDWIAAKDLVITPEPTALALLGLGLVGMLRRR